ncbi:MAG: hypothetical protein NTZ16_15090, partial [Verrucomicrobia bacterium]|nr:hypothetical protein [Verrucomicrobiota bacterium]
DAPQANDTFTLFTLGAAPSGSFSATNLPTLGAGLKWNWTPTNGTLSVVANYASTPTNIVYSVSGSILTLTWPESHLGWYAQSNSVNLADTNYWFDIPGSESATNLDSTIDSALTNVFYRLRMPQ